MSEPCPSQDGGQKVENKIVGPELPTISDNREAYDNFEPLLIKLKQRVLSIAELIKRIGDKESEELAKGMLEIVNCINELGRSLHYITDVQNDETVSTTSEIMINNLTDIKNGFENLLILLYDQKQSFECVKHLIDILKFQTFVFDTLLMVADSDWHDEEDNIKVRSDRLIFDTISKLEGTFEEVSEELYFFSKTTLPKSIQEAKERETTHYLTLTTIATFFSSITAIMLGFSYNPSTTGHSRPTLNNAVNLCWFLSLVFSISSGVNSLLSIIWRNSTVYSDDKALPWFHVAWFKHAPISFLGFSAMFFIVGLNVLAFSSPLPIFIAIATTTATVLHFVGLLIIVPWFMVRLLRKHNQPAQGADGV